MPLNHKIFLAQFETIKNIARKGPCVIVGRCADYVLKNEPNIIDFFISGNTAEKKKRILERYDIEKTKLRTLSARLISGELHTIIITPT